MPKTPKIAGPHTETSSAPVQPSMARRRLLRLGAYVPPAIVGMAIIGSMPGAAFAKSVGSCRPSACKPCIDVSSDDYSNDKKLEKDKEKCSEAQQKWDETHIDYNF